MNTAVPWLLLLFRLFVGAIVVVLSPYSIVVSRGGLIAPHDWSLMLMGGVLIACGTIAYFRSIWDFTSFAPTSVIAAGVYRQVRNPMYLGLVLILAGQTVLLALPVLAAYTATIWLALHLLVLLYEEPAMARRFGAPYTAYRSDVPRWLPRMRFVHRPPHG